MMIEINEVDCKLIQKFVVNERERVEFNLKMTHTYARPTNLQKSHDYHKTLKRLEALFNTKTKCEN